MIPLDSICQAKLRLKGLVHRTPMWHSAFLSERLGVPVDLKLELFQKTGSFKPRGAFNKILSLTEEERKRGIVAVSGGNHAQGAAYAARHLGIQATVVMPAGTAAYSIDATRGYGAKVVLAPTIAQAFADVERLRAEGLVLVHPFDDPLVAAGQGTIGLEILEDVPDVTHVYVSIGGGGLITGIASALKAIRPEIHVIGVETEGADVMSRSLRENRLVEIPITSIARTLGAPKASELTLNAVRKLVEEVVVVSDASAVEALVLIMERLKYAVEPAAACCLVAAERQKTRFKQGDHIVILLCGGNLALSELCEWHQRFLVNK